MQEFMQNGLQQLRLMQVGALPYYPILSRPAALVQCFLAGWALCGHLVFGEYSISNRMLILVVWQRQTIISQFYEPDRLVVEGQAAVCSSIHILQSC